MVAWMVKQSNDLNTPANLKTDKSQVSKQSFMCQQIIYDWSNPQFYQKTLSTINFNYIWDLNLLNIENNLYYTTDCWPFC